MDYTTFWIYAWPVLIIILLGVFLAVVFKSHYPDKPSRKEKRIDAREKRTYYFSKYNQAIVENNKYTAMNSLYQFAKFCDKYDEDACFIDKVCPTCKYWKKYNLKEQDAIVNEVIQRDLHK